MIDSISHWEIAGGISNRVKRASRAERRILKAKTQPAPAKPIPPRLVKSKRRKHTQTVTKVCYSMPPERADEIVAWAERANLSASRFVTEAAFRYAAEHGLVSADTVSA